MLRFDESPRAELGIAAAAAFMGALGVVLGAVAAHGTPDASLVTASQMLMVHAAAVVGLSSWALRSPASPGWWRVAARLILLGAALFAGDIAARTFLGTRLFPMAAPFGGSAMISGWIVAGIAALRDWWALGRSEP